MSDEYRVIAWALALMLFAVAAAMAITGGLAQMVMTRLG